MDSLIPGAASSADDEWVDPPRREVRAPRFNRDFDDGDETYRVGTREWRRGRMLVVAGLSATAIGLLAYGAAWEIQHRGKSTVTQPLLPPSNSSRAVASLPSPDLLKPLSPEEASLANAEKPFVGRPDSASAKFVLKTDAEDRVRAQTCLAQAVYYEAASEGVDGGRAVAQVVLNRLHHPGFPSTVCGVVYQGADRPTGCQFSFACDGSMRRIPVPWLWTRSRQIAAEALAGKVFAPVGHATHYHADYVLPYWADSLDKSVQIGRHIFYRLRSVYGEGRAFSQRYAGTEPAIREPGAAVVIPPAAVTPQLANALIGDEVQTGIKVVEKAAPAAVSPLAVDAARGTLLADGDAVPPPKSASARPKSAAACPSSGDSKALAPLGANDMRAGSGSSGC